MVTSALAPNPAVIIHIVLIVLFLIVVATLFQALYFLARDKGETKRTVKALTWRISLSVLLFVLILVFWAVGLLKPAA
ncbi:MAG: twin transmembrane helix small protein [Gammaproteobacteria bacterium]